MTRLSADEIVRLRGARGRVLSVSSGHVWITQTGDLRDAVLGPGERVRLDRPGLAIVQALDEAEVLLPGDVDADGDGDGGAPCADSRAARDGTVAHLRAVRPEDAPTLGAFFQQLSPLSRLRRFHSGAMRLPAAWLERLTRPDPQREYAVLAVACMAGREVCVGEARYVVEEGAPRGEREVAASACRFTRAIPDCFACTAACVVPEMTGWPERRPDLGGFRRGRHRHTMTG